MIFRIFIVLFFLQATATAPILNYRQLWSKPTLTYSIIKPSVNLSLNDTRTAFQYAFTQFSAVIFKQFNELPSNSFSPADINISFESIDSTNGIGHIMARTSNNTISIDDNEKWKRYNPGEKVDPKQPDITWGIMLQIQFLFRSNNITGASNITLSNFYDYNGNYVLPRFYPLARNATQTVG